MAENRLRFVASAVFFCGYLLLQVVYPMRRQLSAPEAVPADVLDRLRVTLRRS